MKTKLLATATAGLALAALAQSEIIIDSFDTWQYAKVACYPDATNCVSQAAPEALGGERDLGVGRVGGAMDCLFGDVALTFPNAASLSCGPGVEACCHLFYDGFDNSSAINYTGLNGVDLTEGGLCNAFQFGTTSDLGANVDITVYTDATHYSVAEVTIVADPTFQFVDTVLSFSQFVAAGPDGGADFARVGALDFELCNGPEGSDIAINTIRTTYDGSPRSYGFWKTHPAAWPVESLTLGDEFYTKSELLDLLTQSSKGDASLSLAQQLIAAKLNVASGGAAVPEIAEADALLAPLSGRLPYAIDKSSSLRAQMVALASALEDWNTSAE